MLNPALKLKEDLFSDKIAKAATRDGFGKGVVEAGKHNANVVVLCADLKESTRAEWFEKEFPDRFIEVGVAEQAMATIASGMAAVGKIPFIASYAAFSPGRNYEQIRTTIALNNVPVKVMGMHAGVSVGPDGATHQMLEDIGLMRALPNMVVINPIDAEDARKAIVAVAKTPQPTYVRFGRSPTPTFTTGDTPFQVGKALTLWQGARPQVVLCVTGSLAYNALLAARALEAEGIESIVLAIATIKPLDEAAILDAARLARHVLTIEEHQVNGGLGSAVAELLSERLPTPLRRLGIMDEFGQSGDPEELIEHYGLGASSIRHAAEALLHGHERTHR